MSAYCRNKNLSIIDQMNPYLGIVNQVEFTESCIFYIESLNIVSVTIPYPDLYSKNVSKVYMHLHISSMYFIQNKDEEKNDFRL